MSKISLDKLNNPDKIEGRISGSTLKLVAIVTMLIDHIAASIIIRTLAIKGKEYLNYSYPLYTVYQIMRGIGRIAFPIFIFLLIEGYVHTRNRWKYLGRMGIFAILSEIPFDMAFWIKPAKVREFTLIEFGYQNIYFTLFIGLLVIISLDELEKKYESGIVYEILSLVIIAIGALLAYLMKTDYSIAGVVAIAEMFVYRRNRITSFIVAVIMLAFISSSSELLALIGLPLIYYYNGKRGLSLKYVFYLFYPTHLFLLGLIRMIFM